MAQQSPTPATPGSNEPPAAPPPSTQDQPVVPQTAPTATLTPVTVTGTRPSDDFAPPNASLGRVGGNPMDIPQSITIINKALMQSQGATSLQSAVRNIPGVTLGAAEGGTIGNNIYLNGFNARTDLYLDGMRDPAQYYRDTFDLEQIEVLMGPSSMLFGRGSTGGIINQVLKKPSLKNSTELSVIGTSNTFGRTTADVNVQTSDTSAARVNVMFQDGSVSTRQQTQVQDFGVAPSYKFGIGTPLEVTVYGLMQYNHDHVDYGLPAMNGAPANVSPNLAYGFGSDHTDQSVAMAGTQILYKINPDVKLRSQTQLDYADTNVVETAPQSVGTITTSGAYTAMSYTGVPYTNLMVRQQSHDRDINDLTLNNQTELEAKFNTGPLGHTLLAGFDLGYESYRNQAYSRTGTCNGAALPTGYVGCTALLQPNSAGPVLPEVAGNLAMGYAYAAGIYANDTIQLMPEVKLVGGLRYDWYYSQIGNSINTLNSPSASATALPYLAQTNTYLSYRAGVLYQPTKWQTYYVSTSTSFNPSLAQLVSTTGSTPLPPQTSTAYEAGAKYDLLNEQLSLTGAVFQITQYNALTNNGDGTYSAAGTIRVKGVRTGVAGRLTPEWQVFGGYTYLDARIINGIGAGTQGMIPQNTPTDSAMIWTTYTFAKKWEIGGGVTYTGVRYANNTDSTVVPAGYHADATAAYHMETSDLRLNIFNLTNSTYYEQAMASDGGRTVPYTGFTAMLTYSLRL